MFEMGFATSNHHASQEHKVRKLGDPQTAAIIATVGVALFAAAYALPHVRGGQGENDLSFLSLFMKQDDARDAPRKVTASIQGGLSAVSALGKKYVDIKFEVTFSCKFIL